MRRSCTAVDARTKDASRTVPFNMRMDAELRDRLREYCEETGQSMTTAVSHCLDRALDDYFGDAERVHW